MLVNIITIKNIYESLKSCLYSKCFFEISTLAKVDIACNVFHCASVHKLTKFNAKTYSGPALKAFFNTTNILIT